jgi:hypothetical protein
MEKISPRNRRKAAQRSFAGCETLELMRSGNDNEVFQRINWKNWQQKNMPLIVALVRCRVEHISHSCMLNPFPSSLVGQRRRLQRLLPSDAVSGDSEIIEQKRSSIVAFIRCPPT